MSVQGNDYCQKCRTCNALTSNQSANLNATPRFESTDAVGLSAVDDQTKQEGSARPTISECHRSVFELPRRTDDISSTDSSAHLDISSATPSPRSDEGYGIPIRLSKPPQENESTSQHIQEDREPNPFTMLGPLPLQDRNVVGQEKSPGNSSVAFASAAASSLQAASSDSAPKERKRWARPPLIGQAASNNEIKLSVSEEFVPETVQELLLDESAKISAPDIVDISSGIGESSGTKMEKSRGSSSNESRNTLLLSKSTETGDSADEQMPETPLQTTTDGEQGLLSDSYIGEKTSPSSSVASNKRLEWDSGADVGYQDYQPVQENSGASILKLSTIERLAFIQNTDKVLRMRQDPEGTSNSLPSTRNGPTPTFNTFPLSLQQAIGQPSAESTPIERTSSLVNQRKISQVIGISPIGPTDSSKPVAVEKGTTVEDVLEDEESLEDEEEEEKISSGGPRSSSVSRQKSTSLLNLPSTGACPSKFLRLYRSQSDPDLSTDAEALVNDSATLRGGESLSPERLLKGKGLEAPPLSSDSEKTLVHIPPKKDDRNVGEHSKMSDDHTRSLNLLHRVRTLPSTSKGYSCSDTDHQHGLHHHYGVICSSCLINPNEPAPILNPSRETQSSSSTITSSPVSTPHSNNSEIGGNDLQSRRKNLSSDVPIAEEPLFHQREAFINPSTHAARGEGTSACVGKATSFEYLPGRLYESEMAVLKSNVLRLPERVVSSPPSVSTSTDSIQNSIKQQISRHSKQQLVMTSSGDSEDALWSSPRVVSGPLVRDLERGVGVLRDLVHQQAYSSAAQRELVRRVVRRLVSSEYTDDLLERRIRKHNRRRLAGMHTYTAPPTLPSSDKTDTSKQARSTAHRSSKKAQLSTASKQPAKDAPHTETGSQPSDTRSSSANESSSLQSSVGNEPQTSTTKDSLTKQTPVQKVTDAQPTTSQPLPSRPPPAPQPSRSPLEQPLSEETSQTSLPKSVSQTATLRPEPYVTLASVVSITPMTITVQSSPAAVSLTEVASLERPVSVVTTASRAATANAATMTVSPPVPSNSLAGPRQTDSSTTVDVTTEADVGKTRTTSGSSDSRRNKKSVRSTAIHTSHPSQQLEWIKCEINHLKTLEQLLRKHPQILTKPSADRSAPSSLSSDKKSKNMESPTSEDPSEFPHRTRHHASSHSQEPRTNEGPPISILRKPPPPASLDSRITESTLSSSATSVSTAPEYCACRAAPATRPARSSRESSEERPTRPQKRAEPTQPVPRHREPSPESSDSVTRAVTQAVSSRVKALRNLGQIEEAEVKIRVRMGQHAESDGEKPRQTEPPPTPKVSISQTPPPRLFRPVNNAAEDEDFASRQAELDQLIARQRLMDAEARKKLEALTKMRERVLRDTADRFKEGKPVQPLHRDACTLTSCDTATNTTPQSSLLVSKATQIKTQKASSDEAPSQTDTSSRASACPACRARSLNRASAKKLVTESEPMCQHDPGFTAGLPRGRERPPTAYFLKVEEEDVERPVPAQRKVSSLQIVTVKVPRPIRPPSSLGSSSASSASSGASSGRSARSDSGERFPRQMASRQGATATQSSFSRHPGEIHSAPESNRKRGMRTAAQKGVDGSRSEPQLGRGDGDRYAVPSSSSSDEQTANYFTLQDCLTSNFPEYVRAAETRRQCISEMSYLRRLRQESRKRLLQLNGDSWCLRQKMARSQRPKTAPVPAKSPQRRKMSGRSMRLTAARKYACMPEVEQKKMELKKKEESRTNRLLKEIYTRKLREKALRGETTLRSSVSVISSF